MTNGSTTSIESDGFAEIEQTWLDSDHNYHLDMSRTRKASQAKAIDDNWANARAAYVRALADGLSKNTQQIEDALAALREANKAVKRARQDSEKLSKLIKKLQTAAKGAMQLTLLAI